jgi:hypothetical protein
MKKSSSGTNPAPHSAAIKPSASHPERAAAALDELCASVRAGLVDTASLMTGCRLSKTAVVDRVRGFGYASDSALLSHPLTHSAYRRLKFQLEGLTLSPQQVAVQFAALIEEVRRYLLAHPEVRTMTSLWQMSPALYRKVRGDPHARLIFWAAGGPRSRSDLLYWTDEQLLEAAVEYRSLSDLKSRGGELHRHIVGRALLPKLCARASWMVGNFRVGFAGHRYRSQPELILGNWLEINAIPVVREFNTGLRHGESRRAVVADFKLLRDDCLVELLQSDGQGTGSRGRAYDARWSRKRSLYETHDQRFVSVPTDALFEHGLLDVSAFVGAIEAALSEKRIDIGRSPPLDKLAWEDHAGKTELLTLGLDDLVAHLRRLGAVNSAVLQNRFSWALSCLRWRPDFEELLARYRTEGIAMRAQSIRRTREAKRQNYASLAEIRCLCREFGIESQSQWFRFARANRELLLQRRVPANPAGVYGRLGTWSGWRALWPAAKADR